MCHSQTIQDVARHLGVSWDVIKDIQKKDLKRRFGKPKLKGLHCIAIDEIAVAKGHSYRTLVMDLETGAVVFVGEGKGADALKPFWKRLKRSRSKIEAVAMDMSPAYIEVVRTHLPKAAIVFDRFHVIKLFNDKLSELWRSLYHNANGQQKKVLKGSRWLLLKASEHLDDINNEQDQLQEALALNQPLLTAYHLKEELRLFWDKPTKGTAKRFLEGWLRRARASGIKILISMAKTLESHQKGFLTWYDHRISSGPMEGTNNKIKTMKRQANGYRNMGFFELKILSIHETRYALVR